MFEQFPRTEKAGALLGIAANAQRALGAIDAGLLQRLRAAADNTGGPGTWVTYDQDGRPRVLPLWGRLMPRLLSKQSTWHCSCDIKALSKCCPRRQSCRADNVVAIREGFNMAPVDPGAEVSPRRLSLSDAQLDILDVSFHDKHRQLSLVKLMRDTVC